MPYRDRDVERQRRAERYRENKARIDAANAVWAMSPTGRRSNMRSRLACVYGVSRTWFDEKLIEQAGRCDICNGPMSGRTEPTVDHEHEAGSVRGLLCAKCNKALHYVENVEWGFMAHDYLVRHGTFARTPPPPDPSEVLEKLRRLADGLQPRI